MALKPYLVRLLHKGAIVRIDPVVSRVEGDIGWIKIKTFEKVHRAQALKDVIEGVKETLGPRLAGYVIDLRNNPIRRAPSSIRGGIETPIRVTIVRIVREWAADV